MAVLPDGAALAHLDSALAGPRRLPGGPRWTDPARWHVTAVFLGEVTESRVDGVVRRLAEVPGDRPGPRLRLRGAGTFPPRGAPRVLWVGIAGAAGPTTADPATAGADAELAALERIARSVRRAARAAGVSIERRPFRPHLTLGRWRPADRGDRGVAESLADYAGPPFRVAELVLVRSHLGPDPRHERLQAWPLPAPSRA